MPKNLFQDMVQAKRARSGMEQVMQPRPPTNPQGVERVEKSRGRYSFWMVAVASVVFFLFALSYLFANATITVHPKQQNIILNEDLSATKNSQDALPFDLVVISGEESKIVETVGEKDIAQKAEGVVVIYNAFSSTVQKLDINTRLEGSNDKIYKTEKVITVPGMGKDGKPGSVEVKIYGAEAGTEYNSPPLDFKIFGFKGTSKYSKFYGRSKGAITGGIKGKYPFIPESQKENILSEMKISLEAKLFQKAHDQIPDGFILFQDAVVLKIDSESMNPASAQENMLPFTLKGTLYGVLLNEQKLTQEIVKKNMEKDDESEVYIPHIQNLIFSLSDKDDLLNQDIKNIHFNLSGTIDLVSKLEVEEFTAELLGQSKKNLNQILLQYPNIDSAESVISPFWKRSFPDKIKNIKVIVDYPE